MRLFITGATGLIGRRLVLDRLERGDEVVVLSRDGEGARRLFAADANRKITVVQGNPAAPGPWQHHVRGCDGVIHLAGAGIADRRWTASYKKALHSSRVDSTHQVASAIERAAIQDRPRLLINSSAVGYYGEGGERELDESAPAGSDFLAQLTAAWEAQALRLESSTNGATRVVVLRTAPVLDDRGGALSKMVLPFRLWVGGKVASGRQYMPWIHWRDLLGLIDLALETEQLRGALNAAAPHAVRNREFARALGRALHRPSWLPLPYLGLRLVLGEVARYATASQRITPAKALKYGYVFLYPEIEPALESLLGHRVERDAAAEITAAGLATDPKPLAMEASPVIVKAAAVPAAPIKLLAIDVDGTLLNSDGSIAQGVMHACRAAQRAGCVVVLASSAAPRTTRPLAAAIDLPGPTINFNGAVIWNPTDDRPDYHEPLAPELARQIIDDAQARQPAVSVHLDVLDHWHADRIDGRLEPDANPAAQPHSIGPLDEFLREPVTKINLLGLPDEIQQVLEVIRERYWRSRRVAVFLGDPRLIQITHPMVDKGIALQRIARRMNLRREEVMAIGDASNDMGMIEWAGFGVAVDNAYPALKQLAKAIVPSNNDLGVARAIQRYVLAPR